MTRFAITPKFSCLCAAMLMMFIFTSHASAQFFFTEPPQQAAPKPKAPPKPKAALEAAPAASLTDPPYQSRLERLSEILGALHYLRPLCVANEKQEWRELMLQLLDAENPSPERRDRMIGAFNNAYRGFSENYRRCTAAANLAGKRYREEGIRLARDLTSRFTD
ncbi:MAG: TIGR02301 family protein [Pseudomonadota bacterium]